MIEVRDLTKAYSTTLAVDHITFSVRRGEVLGFLGPNGAGKTTTLRIVTGYLLPDEGTAIVDGYDVLTHPLEVKQRIGYLPEDNPLYLEMKVREYLGFVAEARGLTGAHKRNAIERVLHLTNLEDKYHKTIETLSKGYRQRVGLAQALLHDPPILLLDEPTSGLDPTQIVEIRNLIRDLGREKTVMLSTHILPEVQATTSRVIIINRGRIAASGTLEELLQKASEGEVIHLELRNPPNEVEPVLQQQPWIEAFQRVAEEDGAYRWTLRGRNGQDIREDLFKLAVEQGWTLRELWRERATLEEVFLHLTTEEVPA